MSIRKNKTGSRRSYAKITLKKRKALVEAIIQNGLTVPKASKKFKIKLTTVRLILRKFKETGDFPMKNFKKYSKMIEDLAEKPLNQVKSEIKNDLQQEEICGNHQKQENLLNIMSSMNFGWTQLPWFYYYWPVVHWE